MTFWEGRSVEVVGKLMVGSRTAQLSARILILTAAVSPYPGSGSPPRPQCLLLLPPGHT